MEAAAIKKIVLPKNKGLLVSILLAILSIILLVLGGSPEEISSVLSSLAPSDPGWHRVLRVHDGDTIDVDFLGKTETVRFIGVDTPETHHPERPVQCFGKAASSFLKGLIENGEVRLEADPLSGNRDRYGRLLRYVFDHNQTLLNAEIIKQGYGFAYLTFNHSKLNEFELLEDQARENGAGLWQACDLERSGGYINTAPAT